MKNIKKMSGFTLVELLIVIVIIGILAAVGFVAFSGAQNRANKSTAESTVSQLRSKAGEFQATSDNGLYPTTEAAFEAYLRSAAGGNNNEIADRLDGTVGTDSDYVYTTPNSDGSGYTITASKTIWNGGADETDITANN